MLDFLQPVIKFLEEAGVPATPLWMTGYAAAILLVLALLVWRAFPSKDVRIARSQAKLARMRAAFAKRQAANPPPVSLFTADMVERLRRASEEHGTVNYGIVEAISREPQFVEKGLSARAVLAKYHSLGLPYERAIPMHEQVAMKTFEDRTLGPVNPQVLCPHCQTRGNVRVQTGTTTDKTRLNSVVGKVLDIGVNTEKAVTQFHCDNCKIDWEIGRTA